MSRGPISGSCEEGNCHYCEAAGCDHDCHKGTDAEIARLAKLAQETYENRLRSFRAPVDWFSLPQHERNAWIAAASAVIVAAAKTGATTAESPDLHRFPSDLTFYCPKCGIPLKPQATGNTVELVHPEFWQYPCPLNDKRFERPAFTLKEIRG